MNGFRLFSDKIANLEKDPKVAEALGKTAKELRGRVRAPSRMTVVSKHGVSDRGAFAQVRMIGPGALTVEYGNRSRPPLAPLRSAVRGMG